MEGNVGVAEDGVWVGIVEGAPFEGDFLSRPRIAQDLLGGGHVGLACGGNVTNVSCQDGYNPADLGDRAGLAQGAVCDLFTW